MHRCECFILVAAIRLSCSSPSASCLKQRCGASLYLQLFFTGLAVATAFWTCAGQRPSWHWGEYMFPSFVYVSLVIVCEDECVIAGNRSGWLSLQLPKPPTGSSDAAELNPINGIQSGSNTAHSLSHRQKHLNTGKEAPIKALPALPGPSAVQLFGNG